eukprot:gnl/MRDRNA2_/MRDRNA2_303782_c0_seq1.p1 gnl/MRDRNA2_/MRDRNA2_303782_c0~~gnl/MRDRNA2_/MRDRNA2_303782_c0_seq1.p1  ORF type:complete len:114 (-),score=13.58 gnl/MRDRNA2_/MRDRNA2_303782_c0_seq1:156-497(-)
MISSPWGALMKFGRAAVACFPERAFEFASRIPTQPLGCIVDALGPLRGNKLPDLLSMVVAQYLEQSDENRYGVHGHASAVNEMRADSLGVLGTRLLLQQLDMFSAPPDFQRRA